MQSIIVSEKVFMDEDGQITIPRSILDLYDIHDAIDVEIKLRPDGIIQLIPQLPFRKSFYLHASREITESAARAYLQGKEKKYLSNQEIDDLLKD